MSLDRSIQRGGPDLSRLAVPTNGRALLVGMTGTGKSTLGERLISLWLTQHGQRARVLIIDSKPRFRGELDVSGLPAGYRYRRWAHGSPMSGSYVLDVRDPKREMAQVWRLGGRVAIAQGDLSTLPWLRWAAETFYHESSAKYRNLVYYDELADFFGASGVARAGDPALKIIRSGRERGVAFLGATQRPKGVPKSALTELSSLYYFGCAYDDDAEHLREMGYPDEIDNTLFRREPFAFYFYSHARPADAGYYRVRIAGQN